MEKQIRQHKYTSEAIKEKLQRAFNFEDLEFKVQTSGKTSDGKIWAMVSPYVSARAIQERLDEVFGWDGWEVSYSHSERGVTCKLSVYLEEKERWISKEDGAEYTDYEPFKGGISSSLKRTASAGFGIGRYLYKIKNIFAEVSTEKVKGWHKGTYTDKQTKKKTYYYWNVKPESLPDFTPKTPQEPQRTPEKVKPTPTSKEWLKAHWKESEAAVKASLKKLNKRSIEDMTIEETDKLVNYLTN